MQNWYVLYNNQISGPYPADQVRTFVAGTPGVMISRDGKIWLVPNEELLPAHQSWFKNPNNDQTIGTLVAISLITAVLLSCMIAIGIQNRFQSAAPKNTDYKPATVSTSENKDYKPKKSLHLQVLEAPTDTHAISLLLPYMKIRGTEPTVGMVGMLSYVNSKTSQSLIPKSSRNNPPIEFEKIIDNPKYFLGRKQCVNGLVVSSASGKLDDGTVFHNGMMTYGGTSLNSSAFIKADREVQGILYVAAGVAPKNNFHKFCGFVTGTHLANVEMVSMVGFFDISENN